MSLPPAGSSPREFLLGRENYERWRTMPYDPARMGLERMRRLMAELGSPEETLPVIHVAGTKGKGSTSAMIAAMLSAAGLRTGLFTSPHLLRIEERIQIDGRPIDEFDELLQAVRPAVERLDAETPPGETGPTFFEIITAMAFVHFAQQKVQAAVMEVGLGGRLDSTNVCRPAVSIITSISFDHMRQLGNTLAAIAGEKAGIIRPGVPVVSGVVEAAPREVIGRVCRERGAPLVELHTDFDFRYEPPRHLEQGAASGEQGVGGREQGVLHYRPLRAPCSVLPAPCFLSLPGRHQAANAAVALAAIEVLRKRKKESGNELPHCKVVGVLADMSWPARVEVVARRPAVVLDAAHNVASVEALIETLQESFSVARRLLIFGTTQDKDVRGMLAALLGRFDEVFFTRYAQGARAVPAEELQRLAEELTGRRWPAFEDSAAAWAAARQSAGADDLICVTGSFFLAAEMKERLSSKNA